MQIRFVNFLSPSKSARIQVEKSFPERVNDKCLVVGVHIRKGDYANWKGGKYDYPICDYITIMKKILDLFPDNKISFLICSNETLDAEILMNSVLQLAIIHLSRIYMPYQCAI